MKSSSPSDSESHRPATVVLDPVDRADGIPDCDSRRPIWKYVLLIAAFILWMAFLVYCQVGSGTGR